MTVEIGTGPDDGAVINAELTVLVARRNYEGARRRIEERMVSGNIILWLISCHWGLGNWEEAEVTAATAVENEEGHSKAFACEARATSRVGRGRLAEALEDLDTAVAIFAGYGDEAAWAASIVARHHVARAFVLQALGDVDGALQAAQDGIDVDRFAGKPHYARGAILFNEGRTAEAEAMLADLQAMAAESYSPLSEFWVRLLTAEKHLADGEAERALVEVQTAALAPPEHRDRRYETRLQARALEARGDTAGAIAANREFLEPSYPYLGFPHVEFALHEIPVHYDLARLEEAEGDLASAREHYRRFLDSWGEAELPGPEVPDAKARLKALEAKL